jgi:multiple sugar transport system permease protein
MSIKENKRSQRAHSLVNNKKLGYKMLIPATLLISFISVYPLFRGIFLGFMNYNLQKPDKVHFNGIDNFIKIFTNDSEFWGILSYTFIYTIFVVVISYVLGLLFAMLLNRDIKFRGIFRALILIPWIIPPAVAATCWQWLLSDQFGLINGLLMRFHLVGNPVLFLADQSLTRVTVIVTSAWKSFPFMMITLLSGLQTIPENLYEAAEIDGASFRQRFHNITLPMLTPVTTVCTTLMFIWTFNNFENIYLLTQGGPNKATYVLSIYTYYTAFMRSNIGYASSVAIVLLLVMLILTSIYIAMLNREKREKRRGLRMQLKTKEVR